MGVANNAQEEVPGGARQEGGGQDHVAPGSQSGPQGHATGVHVDRAGHLLLYALHPAGSVDLHLGRRTSSGKCWRSWLPQQQSHLEHLEADREVLSSPVFPVYPPVLLLQADQHLLFLPASQLKHELEEINREGICCESKTKISTSCEMFLRLHLRIVQECVLVVDATSTSAPLIHLCLPSSLLLGRAVPFTTSSSLLSSGLHAVPRRRSIR